MPSVALNDKITISFTVSDRAATAKWYETHFGFKEIFSFDPAGWTELSTNTPGVTLGLGDAMEAKPWNSIPVFGVDDLDTSRKALEAAAVKFDGETIVVDGMVKVATFYDPDGNAVMMAEDLSGCLLYTSDAADE